MLRVQRIIQSFTSHLLILLVLLLSVLAVHQDAFAVPAKQEKVQVLAQRHHGPAFHKMALHKDLRHHPAVPTKHHRVRAHRPTIVNLAMPQAYMLQPVVANYHEVTPLPLASGYRYDYFREITPPPPKAC